MGNVPPKKLHTTIRVGMEILKWKVKLTSDQILQVPSCISRLVFRRKRLKDVVPMYGAKLRLDALAGLPQCQLAKGDLNSAPPAFCADGQL
eukprot:2700358-Amphidinium_carterae.1